MLAMPSAVESAPGRSVCSTAKALQLRTSAQRHQVASCRRADASPFGSVPLSGREHDTRTRPKQCIRTTFPVLCSILNPMPT
eukprot:7194488-Prymnesium_polylepis.1